MCRGENTTTATTPNLKNSCGCENDEVTVSSTLLPSSPLLSFSNEEEANESISMKLSNSAEVALTGSVSTKESTVKVINTDDIPMVLWVEYILPFLDRQAWNCLMEASKKIYMLTAFSKLSVDYQNRALAHNGTEARATILSGPTIQPRWPTNQPFLSKKMGGQGQAIESFCTSHDGEYLACSSVLGIIELWNLRTGKLTWKKIHGSQQVYHSRQQLNSPSLPFGSLLKFSPKGYILACAFENKIVLWNLSRAIQQNQDGYHRGHHEQQDSNQVTLEIERCRAAIYDVTYLGFSDDARRLIARYGKTAYIWNIEGAVGGDAHHSSTHHLIRKIPLHSSRSLVTSDPTLTRLAVGSNGNTGSSGNAANTTSSSHDGRSSGTNGMSDRNSQRTSSNNSDVTQSWKGIIHIWDLAIEQDEESIPMMQTSLIVNIGSGENQIMAYRNHVVRGLEFIRFGSDLDDICLVSASLQGEVKFWRDQKQGKEYPSSNRRSNRQYVCVCQFQSPGKIFSLASWSSVLPVGVHQNSMKVSMFLAAGEARGRIRVWKLSSNLSLSSQTPSSSGLSVDTFDPDPVDGNQMRDDDRQIYPGIRHDNSCSSKYNGNNMYQFFQMEECLTTEVGDHVHYDNIKMLSFTPDGRSLVVSRAYDAKIWFQTVWQ